MPKMLEKMLAQKLDEAWSEINWLKAQRRELALLHGLAALWCRDHRHPYLQPAYARLPSSPHTVRAATLFINLGEEDALRDVMPILERVDDWAEAHGYKAESGSDSEEMSSRDFFWSCAKNDKIEGSDMRRRVLVRVDVSKSELCRMEPTGEIRPVLKLVCNDGGA